MVYSRLNSRQVTTSQAEFGSRFVCKEPRRFAFERNLERVFDKLAAAVHKIHPHLTFELSPIHSRRQREFVIAIQCFCCRSQVLSAGSSHLTRVWTA